MVFFSNFGIDMVLTKDSELLYIFVKRKVPPFAREDRLIQYLTILPLVLLCSFGEINQVLPMFTKQDFTRTLHTCYAKISRFIDFPCDVCIQHFSFYSKHCLFFCALCFGLLILIVTFLPFMFMCTNSLYCSIHQLVN